MARHPIHEYFRPAQQDSPMTWKPFPDNPEAQIMGWLQHENYSACYIPIIDNAPVFKFFYCSTCRAWKRISTSTGHIRIHYDSVSHSDERFLEKNQMTPDMASRMMKATTLFLLTNGLPFRLIDDQYFQVLPTLGHRSKLKEVSRKMARSVLNSIKQTLARVSYCSLSVDEWADVTRQRYIGVSCHTRLEGIMRVFTIAHYSVATAIGPDGRDHLNAKDVATIVHEVMKDFQICKKTLLIVTDRASIMQNALTLLTDMRLEDGLVPVLGAPCVCHVVNSLLSKFVKLVSPAVQDVIDIQNKFCGTIFVGYSNNQESPLFLSKHMLSKEKDFPLVVFSKENCTSFYKGRLKYIAESMFIEDSLKQISCGKTYGLINNKNKNSFQDHQQNHQKMKKNHNYFSQFLIYCISFIVTSIAAVYISNHFIFPQRKLF